MTHNPEILIIDADKAFCQVLSDMFSAKKILSSSVQTWREGWDYITRFKPKLILLDNFLPDASGFEQIIQIKKTDPSARVMVISGEMSPGIGNRAIAAGADFFCEKPFNFSSVCDMVHLWMRKSFSSAKPTVWKNKD